MARSGKRLSELAAEIPLFPQQQRTIPVRHKDQWEADPQLADAVRAGARTSWADRGRILVRPSGTEPALRIMVEGEDERARRASWPTSLAGARRRAPKLNRNAPMAGRQEREPPPAERQGSARNVRHRRLHRSARRGARSCSRACARLEYRGYDSAGIALVTARRRAVRREARGQAVQPAHGAARRDARRAAVGLAHTRWATHGRPNDLNAHPHIDCTRRHHGHPQRHHRELPGAARRPRRRAATCSTPRPTPRPSPTSSRRPTTGDLADAVRAALRQADGAYAIAVMHRGEPGRLVGARMNVPLIVGRRRRRELPRFGRGGRAVPTPAA